MTSTEVEFDALNPVLTDQQPRRVSMAQKRRSRGFDTIIYTHSLVDFGLAQVTRFGYDLGTLQVAKGCRIPFRQYGRPETSIIAVYSWPSQGV
jgi:hypothetical protein